MYLISAKLFLTSISLMILCIFLADMQMVMNLHMKLVDVCQILLYHLKAFFFFNTEKASR